MNTVHWLYSYLNLKYPAEMESRIQGSRPRTDFSRTDPLQAKDKNAQGQRQWRIQKILVGGGILSTKPQKFGCLHQN